MNELKKPVLSSKQILDKAFSKAKKMPFSYRTKNKQEFIAKKNLRKIEVVYDIMTAQFNMILDNFPKIDEMEEFERGFIAILLDVDKLKKALYRIKFTKGLNKKLFLSCKYGINHAKRIDEVDKARANYYGRISSVIGKLKSDLQYIDDSRRIINAIPSTKNRYTAVICGFPNTGKSTLMSVLSGATPKIMPYAFTTKKLLFGIVEDKIQLIDTPGVLDNIDSKNIAIQQSRLAAANLGNIIVFLFDFTKDSHYSIEDQMTLKKSIEELNSNMICCVNKIDLMDLTPEKKGKIESLVKDKIFYISAKGDINIGELKKFLMKKAYEYYNPPKRSTEEIIS